MQTDNPHKRIELDLVGEGNRDIGVDDKSNLELKKKFSQHLRDEEIRKTLHFVFRGFIYIAAIALTTVFLIRITHLVIPECWFWLTADQIQGIDKIFFSSAIGGFIASYFSRYKNE